MTEKKKRESWPIAIILVFVVFITGIVFAGVTMMRQEVDLVTEDYYLKELAYQDQINKEILTRTLEKEIQVEADWENRRFVLTYPLDTAERKLVEGVVHLFRPSDKRMDQRFPVAPDEMGRQVIDLQGMAAGMWRIKIDWKEGAFNFYHEERLFLQHAEG